MAAYKKNFDNNEKLFEVVMKKKNLEIRVNYEEKLGNLFKEIRNLQNMKIRVTYSIQYIADEVKVNYPSALALQESLHTYMQISSQLNEKSGKLVAHLRKEVQTIISQGFNYLWTHKTQIQPYVKKFSEKVLELETAVNGLNERIGQIEALCESMKTCSAEGQVLGDKLKSIQEVIDDLSFKSFSNLHIWIQDLDHQIEAILSERLSEQISKWVTQFEKFDELHEKDRDLIDLPTIHELKLQDQIIYIDPPIEYARYYWMQDFHRMLGMIGCLPRLEANRYETTILTKDSLWGAQEENNYFSVIQKVNPELIENALEKVDTIFKNVEGYVGTWLSYQSLWEIEVKKVEDALEDDIDKWQQMLTDIKQGRQTFDNS